MAGSTTQNNIDMISIDELDVVIGNEINDEDQLLIETKNDGVVKRTSFYNLGLQEKTAREAADGILQGQLTTLIGESGLEEKLNVSQMTAWKGKPNGLAELDVNGKVPTEQLPSYVDDVLEGYYNSADGKFYAHYTDDTPAEAWTDGTNYYNADTSSKSAVTQTPEESQVIGTARVYDNKFYEKSSDDWYEITEFEDDQFITDSTAVSDTDIIEALEATSDVTITWISYIIEGQYSDEITPEPGKVYVDLRTNLTYRWSGTAFVIIASDLALGETARTAYRGDRGKIAYDHSQVRGTGVESPTNPHALSKIDIGLENVPNVTTNNQTPTYIVENMDRELTSGESLSVAFGKLAKIVKSFNLHNGNTSNPHSVTKEQIGLGNVTNVATDAAITSGSNNNITSGAVYTALTKKLDANGTAINATYAAKIGVDSIHPAVGSSKVPVYVDSAGDVKPVTSLELPSIQGNVEFTGKPNFDDDVSFDKSIEVGDDARFAKNVSIMGNLYVSGVTTAVEQEAAITSDYLITRLDNLNGLAVGSHSGLAVNNYKNGKMATITADHNGTWRIADSATNTSTVYTNIALFNNVYYTALTHTETTGPTHIITNKRSISLNDTVWYDGYYYHYETLEWKRVNSVTDGEFVLGDAITDTNLIEILEAIDKYTLLYYITVTDNYIDEGQNQPIFTRDEEANMVDGGVAFWDGTVACAKTTPAPTNNMQALVSKWTEDPTTHEITKTFEWKSNIGGGGLSFVGTRAQYEVAKLIPEGNEGYIGPNTLVCITDEDDFLEGVNK